MTRPWTLYAAWAVLALQAAFTLVIGWRLLAGYLGPTPG